MSGTPTTIDERAPSPSNDVDELAQPTTNEPAPIDDPAASLGRVDLQPTGNRVIPGPGALTTTDPVTVELPEPATWILPARTTEDDATWLAIAESGEAMVITLDGTTAASPLTFGPDPRPPFAPEDLAAVARFSDPLPDTRVVSDGPIDLALTSPTDRYPHGVLGDRIEAGSISLIDEEGIESTPIVVDDIDAIEAVSPMVADVDGDGELDVLATVSNADDGARLVVYRRTGEVLAQSAPIGRGNRWRNLLAVASVGPNGELEVIDVRTPHIGGTLQFFRLDAPAGTLTRVAAVDGYSTHSIGSRNLDLGIVSDADGDGRLEVIVPTQSMDQLAVVARVDGPGGTVEVARVELGARMTTNLGAQRLGDGTVAHAVGTDDGRVLLWRA